jgi:DNA/RNA-binding domain of Phe-tRNA-synthetase-like protein
MVVAHDLPGWELAWYRLEMAPAAGEAAEAARKHAAAVARARFAGGSSPVDLTQVSEVRRLFRQAGTDPTRYRPSSEALLRRVLKGDELPAIHPLVDLNNCLSIALAVPSCVMPEGSFTPPLRLRRGAAGERFESLRGDLDLADKPLLADGEGPFGTPISDSLRVAVHPETWRAWMVVYLPAGVVGPRDVERELDALSAIARWSDGFVSGP